MNELRALYGADDAVSSVLGVVLMVAVTIILAAVIGTFVLGIGSDLTDSSPSTQWEFSENLNGSSNGSLTILHGGGEDVEKGTLEITVGGTTVYENGNPVSGTGYSVTDNLGDPVTSGDRIRIEEDGTQFNQGEMVLIIWQTEDSSTILAEERLG